MYAFHTNVQLCKHLLPIYASHLGTHSYYFTRCCLYHVPYISLFMSHTLAKIACFEHKTVSVTLTRTAPCSATVAWTSPCLVMEIHFESDTQTFPLDTYFARLWEFYFFDCTGGQSIRIDTSWRRSAGHFPDLGASRVNCTMLVRDDQKQWRMKISLNVTRSVYILLLLCLAIATVDIQTDVLRNSLNCCVVGRVTQE